MSVVHRIADAAGAVALAELLNGDDRHRPVVVLTIPAGRTTPFIDAEKVHEEVGDLADVYLVATGPQTWTFSSRMPERTQVYGGAGRVYPLGHGWVADPRESPLRFAYDEEEGHRSTRRLISDAFRMAADARAMGPAPSHRQVRGRGEVARIIEDRALVKMDGRIVSIVQELTLPDAPLGRVLAVGQRVEGWYDPDSGRLDIRESLLPVEAALADYGTGDVVLAQVAAVHADRAELALHPGLVVSVFRAQVTCNDLDDLRTLMTQGEVVTARVAATGPHWALTLLDVDDDEEVRPAAALLPGGPPWLLPPSSVDRAADWTEEPPPALVQPPSAATPPARPSPRESQRDSGTHLPPAVPTPAVLARRKAGKHGDSRVAPTPAVASMTLTIESQRMELAELAARLTALEDQLLASNAERDSLVRLRQDQERRIARLERDLQMQRAQLRKARKPATAPASEAPEFADPEQGFRHAVLTAWATRTPVGEQAARPLPAYDIGPDFITSLATVPGVSLSKVADVAFEILTGRAHEIPGRELHQLRESSAGNAAYVRRPSDGAICWRAALQVKTPQARRIHYWVLPGGRVELSRVVMHDDVRP